MGCLFSFFSRQKNLRAKSENVQEITPKLFSWELKDRQTVNKDNFILNQLKGQTIYRLPGSIHGEQFIMENCQDCTVYVFDHTGQVQIDDCINCRILIGPVRGSLFIRDSTNCVLVTVCQQFRTRDCRDLHVYLSCPSQPIIESSHNIHFGCLTLNYEQLAEQYHAAGINPWNNNWSHIHDFTTSTDGKNYSLLNQTDSIFNHLPIPTDPSCQSLNINSNVENSVTPYTCGEIYRDSFDERCFLLFFSHAKMDACARAFISMLRQVNIVLVQTKSYVIDPTSAERLLTDSQRFRPWIDKGPILGLECAGDNCVNICRQTLQNLLESTYSDVPHFISETPIQARDQLDKFYNFASTQMFV